MDPSNFMITEVLVFRTSPMGLPKIKCTCLFMLLVMLVTPVIERNKIIRRPTSPKVFHAGSCNCDGIAGIGDRTLAVPQTDESDG